MLLLLKLMLKEEYRMHVTYSSRTIFSAIPLFAASVSFLIGITIHRLEESISLGEMLTLANSGVFLYGLSVGAFGFLGRTYIERRSGHRNYLIAMPTLLPLSFKKVFFSMFLRDIIFYLGLVLLPAMAGLLIAAFAVHFSLLSAVYVFVPLLLSFMFGISLSFAVSVLFIRSKMAFMAAVGAYILVLIGHGFMNLYGLDMVLPPLGLQFVIPPFALDIEVGARYLAMSIFLILSFIAVAVALVKEQAEESRTIFREILPAYLDRFSFAGNYRSLLAKEFTDLVRSGTVWKMTFSFIVPMVFLSLTTWYVNQGLRIPVGFNTVFYASMVGFFGIIFYSWLTNVDLMDCYGTLPLTVPEVIKTKLILYFFITTPVSTAFVVAIGVINDETGSLWIALPVLYMMSAYMVAATAYLTGLTPSSFLFNPEILVKFGIITILPDLCLTILSFTLSTSPFISGTGIGLVCTVLFICALLFLRGIDGKWAHTPFY